MSDSSNDGSKEANKESEVSSSCSDGRRNNGSAAVEPESDEIPEVPKPRSLSPDTSDAVASDNQAGASHQLSPLESSGANSFRGASAEVLISTTEDEQNVNIVAESSHEEEIVSEATTQQEVSSAHTDKGETKSSSSDEYFEADESTFQDTAALPVTSESQEHTTQSSDQNPSSHRPWELEVSSESISQATVSSVQCSKTSQAVTSESNPQVASPSVMPKNSWQMLMSYESSSDEGEAESSNQHQSMPPVSRTPGELENVAAGQSSTDKQLEVREISTSQQPIVSVSPSDSQTCDEGEPGSSRHISLVSASVSSVREEETESASSSQLQPERGAVSGSQDLQVEEQSEAGTSISLINENLGSSNLQSDDPDETSNDQQLTSSGQPSTSISGSRRSSGNTESSPSNHQLSSSHQPDVSDSQEEDIEDITIEEDILTSSGQHAHLQSEELNIAESSQGNFKEAEASAIQEAEVTDDLCSSQLQSLATVSGSDDLEQSEPEKTECDDNSEAGQSSSSVQQVHVDASCSNDSPEEDIGMSSSLQTGPRPDSPSSQRATDRQAAATSNQHRTPAASYQSFTVAGAMSSSTVQSASCVSQSRDVEEQTVSERQAESSNLPSLSSNQPSRPSVSSASSNKRTGSSDEEPGSALPQLSSSSSSTSQQQRPPEPARMSVLAQQLTVSSASARNNHPGMLRQLITSQNEGGVFNRQGGVGPDSTTMEQSGADNGEEVSTTEGEHPEQVSTSQQRVVSTSWPQRNPSSVSSSVDSSAGHISTSVQLGGLLASRLSRDPQVSTSANAASMPRDHESRDGGASSTTSGLRGLLSSAPRPVGVSSSSKPHMTQMHFSSPPQSTNENEIRQSSGSSNRNLEQERFSAEAERMVPRHTSHVHAEANQPPTTRPQPSCSSSPKTGHKASVEPETDSSRPRVSVKLCTAPDDQSPDDPDKKPKKRRKLSSNDRDDSSAKPSQPGPSKEPPKDDLPSSASLVEQLRKAGVIVTPVAQPTASTSDSRSTHSSFMNNPPIHSSISRIQDQVDSSSSDDIQVLGLFGNQASVKESCENSAGEMEEEFVVLDPDSQGGGDEKPQKKKRNRKPIDMNPDLLRAKRPRRAKEKPESEDEDKDKDKDKPKRGRKKKEQVDPAVGVPKSLDVPMPDVPLLTEPKEPSAVSVPVAASPKTKQKQKAKKAASKVVREPPSRPQDEDTRMSADDSQQSRPPPSSEVTTPSRQATRKESSKFCILPELDICAEALVEYQWPQNDRLAESYMIQEQVTQYLGIKSFKRKYPDLKRRPVELEEREFLQERGLVSEAMCDLGLTAVQSSEVLDIMSADFQEKYEEYRRALRDKQAREISGKQKAAAAASGERGRQVDQKMRAIQSASKWNASLNRDRRDERRCCCDLQTLSVQFPQQRVRAMTKEVPKLGTYPVSLIPGQFTDYYKRYTPAELRYLPLNTVLYGPIHPNDYDEKGSEGSQSDSEDSSSSDDSSSSSSSDGTQDTEETGSTAAEPEPDIPTASASTGPPVGSKCKVCSLPESQPESMVTCAQCSSSGHLNCLSLSSDMLLHIRRYAWQCTDCKNCIQCKDPADEDKMLFCDMCDRGYHIYCVGLRKVPDGRWHCKVCAVCGSCGSLDPAGNEAETPTATPEKIVPQWQHEFKKGDKGTRWVYAQTLCIPCSRLWRKGSFCQLCYRCFLKPDVDSMISCTICEKWMHAGCCTLAPGVELPKTGGSSFVCEVCQVGSQVRSAVTTPRMKAAARV